MLYIISLLLMYEFEKQTGNFCFYS